MRRRVPQEAAPLPEPSCPICPHKVEDHNQFGCCFKDEVCPCLMSPAKIAEHNQKQEGN